MHLPKTAQWLLLAIAGILLLGGVVYGITSHSTTTHTEVSGITPPPVSLIQPEKTIEPQILPEVSPPVDPPNNPPPSVATPPSATPPAAAQPIPSQTRKFTDNFTSTYTLEENGQKYVTNKDWWLNSGGQFFSGNGIGSTIQGALAVGSKWQVSYAKNNADETDTGLHPQNIFRLVSRTTWKNFTQQAYFRIDTYNTSKSSFRKESNGFFLFNRYMDGDNLYYTGIRVDGTVSIKKKVKGVYYDMGNAKIIKDKKYNRTTMPNLLPEKVWIGFRSIVQTNSDNTVSVSIYLDLQNTGSWQKALEVKDNGKSFGGAIFSTPGYAGIRTDFMDASFKNYSIEEKE